MADDNVTVLADLYRHMSDNIVDVLHQELNGPVKAPVVDEKVEAEAEEQALQNQISDEELADLEDENTEAEAEDVTDDEASSEDVDVASLIDAYEDLSHQHQVLQQKYDEVKKAHDELLADLPRQNSESYDQGYQAAISEFHISEVGSVEDAQSVDEAAVNADSHLKSMVEENQDQAKSDGDFISELAGSEPHASEDDVMSNFGETKAEPEADDSEPEPEDDTQTDVVPDETGADDYDDPDEGESVDDGSEDLDLS